MKEKIIEILGRYTDIHDDITDSTSIYDLGLNSLDIASFVGDIEEEFDCEIEEEKLPEIEKIGDIISLLEAR
jgi:acyl carrier protein